MCRKTCRTQVFRFERNGNVHPGTNLAVVAAFRYYKRAECYRTLHKEVIRNVVFNKKRQQS